MEKDRLACNPYLILALGITGVSFSAFLARLTTGPPGAVAFWRLTFTCVLLAPSLYRERRSILTLKKADVFLSICGGFFLALHFLAWFASLKRTSISNATLLVNIHPLIVVTVDWLKMKRLPLRALPWAGTALVGVSLVSGIGIEGKGSIIGNLLAAGGGLMLAGYYLTGRRARARIPIGIYTCAVYGSSALFLFVGNIAAGTPILGYSPSDWLTFVALAAAPTVCGHTLLNWTLKYLPASTVSVAALGEPVLATILAIPLLNEVPSPLSLLGGLLVIIGIAMFMRKSRP